MTEPSDPPRLSDSPGGLGDAMRSAQTSVGSPEQVASLAARLAPLLGPAPAGPPPAGPATGGAGLGAAKLVVSGIALIVAGGAAWQAATYQPEPAPAPPMVPAAVSPPAASVSPPTPPPVPPAPTETVERVERAEASSPSASPRAEPQKAARLSEAELLEQARSAMKNDPARALARANEHRQRFPGGALVQEREVIAIKALRALGRTREADARSEAFSKAFPGSAFERKLKPNP